MADRDDTETVAISDMTYATVMGTNPNPNPNPNANANPNPNPNANPNPNPNLIPNVDPNQVMETGTLVKEGMLMKRPSRRGLGLGLGLGLGSGLGLEGMLMHANEAAVEATGRP